MDLPEPGDTPGSEDIWAARTRVYRYARRTPLLESGGIFLKLENLQPIGAFKIRGAGNFILKNLESLKSGVVTASSGNHGSAVAYVCSRLGIPCTVTVPEDIPEVKRKRIEDSGAVVIPAGTTSRDRHERAAALAREHGWTLVPSFDHPDIIAGQGTIGWEILEVMEQPGTVLVPLSGGGLLSGIARAVKTLSPRTRVVGVEPEKGRRYHLSRQAGRPVRLASVPTIADGLRVIEPGRYTYPLIERYVDDLVAVRDEEMIAAMGWLARECRQVVEPSGAAAVAAALAGSHPEPVVAVVSGGNVDLGDYIRWLTASQNPG